MAESYDLITVGGGLGAAALARSLAEKGARVLVIEREEKFKDRMRGEMLVPGASPKPKRLGLQPCCAAVAATICAGWISFQAAILWRIATP